MKIIEYEDKYKEDIKDLSLELQEHLVSVDDLNIQILNDKYREQYFLDMMQKYNENISKIYIAIEDNKVLGFVFGIIQIYTEHDKLSSRLDKVGRVEELCVTKNTRSKGIGTLLMKEIELFFKDNSCEYIYIEAFGPNKRAQEFYYKNGYKIRNIEVIKKVE